MSRKTRRMKQAGIKDYYEDDFLKTFVSEDEVSFPGPDEGPFTPFNLNDELEEGEFDKCGNFLWNPRVTKKVRDNWTFRLQVEKILSKLVDSSDDSSSDEGWNCEKFDEIGAYKAILAFLQPKETISDALLRLGRTNRNLSSMDRLKRKKLGQLESTESISNLTELANRIFRETGNMDVYSESYESILEKITKGEIKDQPQLDMFAEN